MHGQLGVIFNAEVASLTLGHYARHVAVFMRYYSRGLANLDLIRTRLLEVTTEGHDAAAVAVSFQATIRSTPSLTDPQEKLNRDARTRAAAIIMVGRADFDDLSKRVVFRKSRAARHQLLPATLLRTKWKSR